MTSDDQQFLDLLASIPQHTAHYGGRVADYIEKHTNAIASDIRDAIDSVPWFPDSLRPARQNGSHHFFAQAPPPPQGMVEKTTAWISRNRTAIAIVVAFASTTFVLIHRRRKAHARKRRAKKLRSGGKKEIVILACSSFHDPLTKSLAVDLERRGYIVYITVSTTEEDSLVQQEAKPDLRPLWIDLTSTTPNPTVDIHPNLEPIKELISRPSRSSSEGYAYPKAAETLSLAGLIIFPGSSGCANDSLINIPPSEIIDTVNTRLLAPLLTVQQFLPLLSNYNKDPLTTPSIILAYPSIPLSLSSPNQIPDVITSASISALTASLRREIKSARTGITLTELRLGNFDIWQGNSRPSAQEPDYQSQALTHWHSSQRAANRPLRTIKGSSSREFHNAVFDALAPPQTYKPFGSSHLEWTSGKTEGVVFVGSGARFYDVVGKIVPASLVGWMMGYHNAPTGNKLVKGTIAPKGSDAAGAVRSVWGTGSAGSESGVWEKV